MNSKRDFALLAVIAIALGLLWPGISKPVLTLSGTIDKADVVELGLDLLADERQDPRTRQTLAFFSSLLGLDRLSGELAVYQETRSILGTVQELARTGNPLVAVLIALFSVVIPLAKLVMQLLTLLLRAPAAQAALERVVRAIGKWSMADVFVMALVVTYLAGSASGHLGELMRLDARLEPGFWYFLGYCLFSIASSLLLVRPLPGAQPRS